MRITKAVAVSALLIGLVVAVAPGPAAAASITVTTTADIVAADGQTSLREAIETASSNGTDDEIVLAPVDYQLTDCVAGALLHDEDQDLTILGNGATITQTCTDEPVLVKTSVATVVLDVRNLTIVTAPNSGIGISGAAIDAKGQLLIDDLTVDGADVGPTGSVIRIDFSDETFDLELRNSSITNSTGSAIDNVNPSGALIEGTLLSGNAGNGLGISDGTPLRVVDTMITNNGGNGIVTSGQGFGIQPVVEILNSTLDNNAGGGFLCLSSCRTLTVEGSQITNNGASASPGRGGGVVMPIVLDGGVLASVTIDDSTISGNDGEHPGGGVFVFGSFESSGDDQPPVSITNSEVSNNTTVCGDCDGGGVAVLVGDLSIIGSTMAGNESTGDGGAVSIERGDQAVVDEPADLIVTGTTFTDNEAAGDGGAIRAQANSVSIEQSTFDSNSAGGAGGGVSLGGVFNDTLLASGDATVEASTFTGNDAANGGAVRLSNPNGSIARLVNSTVHDNSATTAGGGFFVGPTELLDLLHTTVTDNDAPAGSNLAANGPVTIAASIIADGSGSSCQLIPGQPVIVVPNIVSLGVNWFDDSTCAPAGSDLVDAGGDPLLGPLDDNGGPTLTRLPAAESGAAGLVPIANCVEPSDQRGVSRPVGPACDAGAVEVLETLPPLPPGLPVNKSGLNLVLNGDGDSERFDVKLFEDYARITYDADLTDPANLILVGFVPGPFRNVRATLRGGDDVLSIECGTIPGLLRVVAGTGNDRMELNDVVVERNLVFEGGAGDDEVFTTILTVDRLLRLTMGSGDDRADLFDINVRDVVANLGTGNDRMQISGASIQDDLGIAGGSGDDSVTLAEVGVNGNTLIQGGSGDDDLRVFVSSFDRFTFRGQGDDDDAMVTDSTFDGPSEFSGGSGTDSFVADAASVFNPPPVLISIP